MSLISDDAIEINITVIKLALYSTVLRIVVGGALFRSYLHIYEYYRICELPWNETSTWIIAALGYDFCYYWLHRFVTWFQEYIIILSINKLLE